MYWDSAVILSVPKYLEELATGWTYIIGTSLDDVDALEIDMETLDKNGLIDGRLAGLTIIPVLHLRELLHCIAES